MNFLKNNRLFDFLYDGKPFSERNYNIVQTEKANTLTTVYTLEDGLKITNIAQKKGDAYEWVNWFENTSDQPSLIISELYDACISLALPQEEPLGWTAFQPNFEDVTAVYAPTGSSWDCQEFSCFPDNSTNNIFDGQLAVGKTKEYTTSGGRSSEKNAPFFNVHKQGIGYIFAIGWTGQWKCILERTTDSLLVKTKIEDTHFRLLPGEKIRTSSFVLLPYKGSVAHSHNLWRALLREHYSVLKQGEAGPLSAGIWGGMKTELVLDRIDSIKKNQLPFEYLWVDAGWYGGDTAPSLDEFQGDWWSHTGDWRVSPLIHPNGFKVIADAAHKAGMKFLLWFEPERARKGQPIVNEHPEYFLYPDYEEDIRLLLNLGDEGAWNYCFNLLAGMIEEIGIDCYRQDFNTTPLYLWQENDAEDRKGITEIKYIMGLYRLWDALLAKFPNLLIDNCASGGRRLDIETLRRSIPLWRSDYQCPANYRPEGAQCHNLAFNLWMPYSGTGSGRMYDTYRFRSAYSPALSTNYTFSGHDSFGDEPEKMEWLKKHLHEYLRVRPYMTEDFYPLTQVSSRKDVWSACQFDRPSQGDGMVQVFRRDHSPYETAAFCLYNIDKNADYIFTDADDESQFVISGASLLEKGFPVSMKEKYSSKIYFYKKA